MIEVLKQALEKIAYVTAMDYEYQRWAREALAIAELESQEPVAKLKTSNVLLRCHRCGFSDKLNMQIEYTHPPQRTWVGLTDEERSELVTLHHGWNEYGQAIETKLKEKNT